MPECAWCGFTNGFHEPMCLAAQTVEPPRPLRSVPTIETARRKRDRAIGQAMAHADDEWKAQARALIERLARERPWFTSDDVWLAGLPTPHEPRALGGVFQSMSGSIVEPTDRVVQSVRRHAAKITVWRSLIYRGAEEPESWMAR